MTAEEISAANHDALPKDKIKEGEKVLKNINEFRKI
jgi:hypothetical protein